MNKPDVPLAVAATFTPAADVPAWFVQAIARPGVSRFVPLDGRRIHCLTWDFEATAKPVLLLLHGYWGHAHWWDFIAPSFLERYRIVALDFSGMGDSDHLDRYDMSIYDRDIAGVIETLQLGAVTAVGHSFGGARLLRACADHPAMFRHAVVVDSYVHFPAEDGPIPPPEPVKGTRIYPSREAGVQRFRLVPPQAVTAPCLAQHIAWHSLRQVEGGWRWKFDSDMSAADQCDFDGPAMLAHITAPVDVVYGGASSIVSADRAAWTFRDLANPGRLVEMSGAEHHVMLDHPLELIDTLRNLLDRTI